MGQRCSDGVRTFNQSKQEAHSSQLAEVLRESLAHGEHAPKRSDKANVIRRSNLSDDHVGGNLGNTVYPELATKDS